MSNMLFLSVNDHVKAILHTSTVKHGPDIYFFTVKKLNVPNTKSGHICYHIFCVICCSHPWKTMLNLSCTLKHWHWHKCAFFKMTVNKLNVPNKNPDIFAFHICCFYPWKTMSKLFCTGPPWNTGLIYIF